MEESTSASQSVSLNRVSVKLPPFWQARPSLWFQQVEANFALSGITCDDTRYRHVLAVLDQDTVLAVSDSIDPPPATDKYQTLKASLLREFSISHHRKLQALMTELQLGDQKPSQLLRKMKDLSGQDLSEDAIRSLWLQRLPQQLQTILSASQDTLPQLAITADRVFEVSQLSTTTTISTVTSPELPGLSNLQQQLADLTMQVNQLQRQLHRPRSSSPHNSRQRSSSPQNKLDLCWYHRKFGTKARKCQQPCSENKHFSQQSGNFPRTR